MSGKPKLTQEQFENKANEKHNNFYDYSLSKYINYKTKIKIKCPQHNIIFKQTPNKHLCGHGCIKCGKDRISLAKRSNTKKFIKKAKLIHGDTFDYSLVEYKYSYVKIKIICKIHGIFEQSPANHLNGYGCNICAIEKDITRKNLTTEEFIKRAKIIHGDKYDYSSVKYINSHIKIKIICQIHGKFEQMPTNHLSGNECPKCNSSKGENFISKFLTHNNISFEQQYRIKDCKNKKPLPFDFYIPSRNLLIEFQGEQHYTPLRFLSKKDGIHKLKQIKLTDKIKKEYCLKHNIRLELILYNDNIENRLKEIFNL